MKADVLCRYFLFGWAFAYGDKTDDSGNSIGNPFIGTNNFAMSITDPSKYNTFVFQYVVRPACSNLPRVHKPNRLLLLLLILGEVTNCSKLLATHSEGGVRYHTALAPENWGHAAQFAISTATIVSGAVAERVKFVSYALYAFFLTAWVYPGKSFLPLGLASTTLLYAPSSILLLCRDP